MAPKRRDITWHHQSSMAMNYTIQGSQGYQWCWYKQSLCRQGPTSSMDEDETPNMNNMDMAWWPDMAFILPSEMGIQHPAILPLKGPGHSSFKYFGDIKSRQNKPLSMRIENKDYMLWMLYIYIYICIYTHTCNIYIYIYIYTHTRVYLYMINVYKSIYNVCLCI